MVPNFAYVRPESLDEAIKHLSSSSSRVHAGGTDLLGCLRDGVFSAEKVVAVSKIDSLKGIAQTGDGGLRIGALTSVAEVAAHPLIRERYTALADGASQVASPQLRNQGTVGGNLCQKPRCWYYRGEFHCLRKGGSACYAAGGQNQYHCIFGGDGCYIVHPSDMAPALVAFDAVVTIAGPNGTRQVPVARFHVPPSQDPQSVTVLETGEVVTQITLPAPPAGLRSSYRKVRARNSWDFALVGVALALQFSGSRVTQARVVFSGAAPIPWRSAEVESAITGKELTEANIGQAAEAAVQKAEPLEYNGYKVPLLKGLIKERLTAIAQV